MKKTMTVMKRMICMIFAVLVSIGLWHHNTKGEPAFLPARIPEATLIIDAGHGGEDGGAVSLSGTIESHINLEIALRIGALMDLYGIDHILLRDTDRSLHDDSCVTLREKKVSDLRNRVAAIESTPNAVVMSIHQNTFTKRDQHGAQVFFGVHEQSIPLAQIVQSTLQSAVDTGNNRVPAAIPRSVYLMQNITCPAILVECGFLSNPTEEQRLKTPGYQTKLAVALTSAYIAYQENTEEEPAYESS